MTLPVSPNPISLSQVNAEIGRAANTTISLNESVVRTLFRDTQGQIAMSTGRGKQPMLFITELTASYGSYDNVLVNGAYQRIDMFGVSPSRFNPTVGQYMDVLVVGGGAGGDYRYNSGGGGGGGGGVYAASVYFAPLPFGQWYEVNIGTGGGGSGTTFAGASGGTSSIIGGTINITCTGGLPSGYSGGYNYGRGGSPNGVNGGNIGGYAGTNGTYSTITGTGVYYGSGGGGGGTSGGAGGSGAGAGGGTNQYGGNATTPGSGGGGGGYYTGGTYYYGGNGRAGCVYVRSNHGIYVASTLGEYNGFFNNALFGAT